MEDIDTLEELSQISLKVPSVVLVKLLQIQF